MKDAGLIFHRAPCLYWYMIMLHLVETNIICTVSCIPVTKATHSLQTECLCLVTLVMWGEALSMKSKTLMKQKMQSGILSGF